jgi:hypothetical protein
MGCGYSKNQRHSDDKFPYKDNKYTYGCKNPVCDVVSFRGEGEGDTKTMFLISFFKNNPNKCICGFIDRTESEEDAKRRLMLKSPTVDSEEFGIHQYMRLVNEQGWIPIEPY